MDFHSVRSPKLNSPRGVPESNGRAVISALRTLQSKIREMELSKSEIQTPQRIQSPRSVNSVGTDSECSAVHRAAQLGQLAQLSPRSSQSSKGYERSAALEAELSQVLAAVYKPKYLAENSIKTFVKNNLKNQKVKKYLFLKSFNKNV